MKKEKSSGFVATSGKEYVIPDHSISGLELEGGSGRAGISKEEFACLLMFLSNFSKLKSEASGRVLPIKILGYKLYFDVTQNIVGNNSYPYKKVRQAKDVPADWLKAVDKIFSPEKGRSTPNESTSKVELTVYGDKQKHRYHSKFTFFINKSGSRFFINANCSPTQLLTGDNSLPIKSFSDLTEKAEFFIQMFTLPFIFIGTLLDDYVLQKGQSDLTKTAERNDIILQKIQLAAYSKAFKNSRLRNLAIEILYQIFNSSVVHNDFTQSSDIASALGFGVENILTTVKTNKKGQPLSRSGIMLKFNQGIKNPTYSMGLYAKDMVNAKKKEEKAKITGGYSRDFVTPELNSQEIFVQQNVDKSIRLDLSIHKIGLISMSKYFHKQYDTPVLSEQELRASHILEFLKAMLKVDPTLGVVFQYVFEHEMRLDQLLNTTVNQWKKAFDILIQKGYGNLVEQLKNRQNLNAAGGDAFTSLVRKCTKGKADASRLLKEIKKATELHHPETGELIYSGVDIRFPYRVQQRARHRAIEIFNSPDALDTLYDTGMLPNSYRAKDIEKQARLASLRLYRKLLHGKIRDMPVQGRV